MHHYVNKRILVLYICCRCADLQKLAELSAAEHLHGHEQW